MNINRMTDEELAKDIYHRFGGVELSTRRKLSWDELCPNRRDYYIDQVKFIRQCVKDS